MKNNYGTKYKVAFVFAWTFLEVAASFFIAAAWNLHHLIAGKLSITGVVFVALAIITGFYSEGS